MEQDTNCQELINALNDDERRIVSWVVAAVEAGASSGHAEVQAWYQLFRNATQQGGDSGTRLGR